MYNVAISIKHIRGSDKQVILYISSYMNKGRLPAQIIIKCFSEKSDWIS